MMYGKSGRFPVRSGTDIVTHRISGHSTARMQEHYSTVRGEEQRAGLARVIQLVQAGGGGKSGVRRSASGGME